MVLDVPCHKKLKREVNCAFQLINIEGRPGDVDAKVKPMTKLIEEETDSFARREEMYYKKRPELMKLVEEFYRAYRALAERYDHATGELRQAHRTMAEAFPNQIPFNLSDDSPPGSTVTDIESERSVS
ncbi:NETWORKED 1A protein [Nymphaea thermarum]|nr:NETWORKED 1A protein [Nymphaea thermarum]